MQDLIKWKMSNNRVITKTKRGKESLHKNSFQRGRKKNIMAVRAKASKDFPNKSSKIISMKNE
jgi:hypothetical protein